MSWNVRRCCKSVCVYVCVCSVSSEDIFEE